MRKLRKSQCMKYLAISTAVANIVTVAAGAISTDIEPIDGLGLIETQESVVVPSTLVPATPINEEDASTTTTPTPDNSTDTTTETTTDTTIADSEVPQSAMLMSEIAEIAEETNAIDDVLAEIKASSVEGQSIVSYTNNYQSMQPEPYKTILGTVTAEDPNNGQIVSLEGNSAAVLEASPYLSSGVYTLNFRHNKEFDGEYESCGVGIIIKDDIALRFDANKSSGVEFGTDWVLQKADGSGAWLNIKGENVPSLEPNVDHILRVAFHGNRLVLELNGEVFYDGTTEIINTGEGSVGQVGLYARNAANIDVNSISIEGMGTREEPAPPVEPAETYEQNYEDGYVPNWSGGLVPEVIEDPRNSENNVLKLASSGDARYIDLDSPMIKNGSISLDFNVAVAGSGFSFGFRMLEDGTFSELGYTVDSASDWLPEKSGGWGSKIGIGELPADQWNNMIINFTDDTYQIYINGENKGTFEYDFNDNEGHFGLRLRRAQLYIDNLVYSNQATHPAPIQSYENNYEEGVSGEFSGSAVSNVISSGANNVLALDTNGELSTLDTGFETSKGTASFNVNVASDSDFNFKVASNLTVSYDGTNWILNDGENDYTLDSLSPLTTGKFNNIAVNFENNVVNILINGELATLTLNSALTEENAGKIAFSSNGTVYIDDLLFTDKIYKLEASEVTFETFRYEEFYDIATSSHYSGLTDVSVSGGYLNGKAGPQASIFNDEVQLFDNGIYKVKMSSDKALAIGLGNLTISTDENGLFSYQVSDGEKTTIGASTYVLGEDNIITVELIQGEITLYINNKIVGDGFIPADAKLGRFKLINNSNEEANIKIDSFGAEELIVYIKDYDDGADQDWKQINGSAVSGTINAEGKLELPMGVFEAYDNEAPSSRNQEISFKYAVNVDATSAGGRYGFVLRSGDGSSDSVAITHDINGAWTVQSKGGATRLPVTLSLEKDREYLVQIETNDLSASMAIIDTVNGDVYDFGTFTIPAYDIADGKFGLKAWYSSKTVTIDDLKIIEKTTLTPLALDAKTTTLSKDNLSVVVDSNFPNIYSYTIDGATMETNSSNGTSLLINGREYTPEVSTTVNEDSVEYLMTFDEIDVTMTAVISLDTNNLTGYEAKNVVNLYISNISEEGNFLINTISFGDKTYAHATESDTSSGAWTKSSGAWHGLTENIIDSLSDIQSTNKVPATYAFLADNGLSVSIENNVMSGGNKVYFDQVKGSFINRVSLSNGEFTYRHVQSPAEDTEEYPYMRISIGTEVNDDGKVDWQDGVTAFRRNALDKPFEYEDMANNMMYIPFNFASTATDPFLNTLDTAKVLYNYTDGFGQMVLHKGYQNEGHDSGIPSYSDVGIRQGGVEDFKTMLSVGDDYNLKVGVHLNATEYHLDAEELYYDNLTGATDKGPVNIPTGSVKESGWDNLAPGWDWVDTTFYVDQTKDVLSGELHRRFEDLHDTTKTTNSAGEEVGIDFYYIDVYTGNDYNAMKLLEYANDDLGIKIGTEFAGPLEPGSNFVHWGPDLGYPNKGNGSLVYRMVKNDQDLFVGNALFKGQKIAVTSTWGDSKPDVDQTIKVFFNEVLPTKYMQHFGVLKLTEDEIMFEEGVYSTRNHDNGMIELTKDGNLISSWVDTGTTTDEKERHAGEANSLIPWMWDNDSNVLTAETGAKLYHWNTTGTSTTYTLTDDFAHISSFDVYELTQQGRTLVGTVSNSNGTVTLNTDKNTGYVLYPSGVDAEDFVPTASDWGEGSEILDFAFNSEELGTDTSDWKVSMDTSASIEVVAPLDGYSLSKEMSYSRLNRYLELDGTGAVYQDIEVKEDTGYVVSVWVKTPKGQDSALSIEVDGKVYEKTVSGEDGTHYTNFKYRNETWQRIDIDIDVPAGITEARVTLKTNGDGAVLFDDAKIFEHIVEENFELNDSLVAYEDFENISQGYGIFEYGGGSLKNQLKELPDNEITTPGSGEVGPLFTWVLEGRTSLKLAETDVGRNIKTSENGLKLAPNTEYKMDFLYTLESNATYEVVVRSRSNPQDVLLTQTLVSQPSLGDGTGTPVSLNFTTGENDDYQVIFQISAVSGGKTEQHAFILDAFSVEKVSSGVDITSETRVLVGSENTLTATLADGITGDIMWTSSDDSILTVDENGLMTAVSAGRAYITATASGVSDTVEFTVYQEFADEPEPGTNPDPEPGVRPRPETETETEIEDPETPLEPSPEEETTEDATSEEVLEKYSDLMDDWSLTGIVYATNKGLMNGVSDTEFAPNEFMTRAMLVTVLNRLAGEPEASSELAFDDVSADIWYGNAVAWASENGYVNGVSDTEFAPNNNITRRDLVTILWRYAGSPILADYEGLTAYEDAPNDYSSEAFAWAHQQGIINGTSESTLSPDKGATRAEVATMIMRFQDSLT